MSQLERRATQRAFPRRPRAYPPEDGAWGALDFAGLVPARNCGTQRHSSVQMGSAFAGPRWGRARAVRVRFTGRERTVCLSRVSRLPIAGSSSSSPSSRRCSTSAHAPASPSCSHASHAGPWPWLADRPAAPAPPRVQSSQSASRRRAASLTRSRRVACHPLGRINRSSPCALPDSFSPRLPRREVIGAIDRT